MCVSNVLLENVNITADRPSGVYYANGVRSVDVKITTPVGVTKLSSAEAQFAIMRR